MADQEYLVDTESPVAAVEPDYPDLSSRGTEIDVSQPKADDIEVVIGEPGADAPRLELGADLGIEEDPTRFPQGMTPKEYQLSAKDRLRKQTFQIHEADRQRMEAIAQRNELLAHTKRLSDAFMRMQATARESHAIAKNAATLKVDSEFVGAQKEFQDAQERADYAAAAAATAKLSNLAAQRQQLAILPEMQEIAPPPMPVMQQQAPTLSERQSTWAQRNPWFRVHDGGVPANEETAHALFVHGQIADKFAPDSEEYYRAIDQAMQSKFSRQPAAQPQRKSSPVAPSTRVSGGGDKKTVTLTASQASLARSLGLSYADYAKQVLAEGTANG